MPLDKLVFHIYKMELVLSSALPTSQGWGGFEGQLKPALEHPSQHLQVHSHSNPPALAWGAELPLHVTISWAGSEAKEPPLPLYPMSEVLVDGRLLHTTEGNKQCGLQFELVSWR